MLLKTLFGVTDGSRVTSGDEEKSIILSDYDAHHHRLTLLKQEGVIPPARHCNLFEAVATVGFDVCFNGIDCGIQSIQHVSTIRDVSHRLFELKRHHDVARCWRT